MSSETSQATAEQRFRHAFIRLKANKPTTLDSGTPVSQNNVAKEAGCDPTALRKARFPALVREIQAYVEIHQQERPSKRKQLLKQRKARTDLKQRIKEVEAERDQAQSLLGSAQRRIVELSLELNVVRVQLDELKPPPTFLARPNDK